MEATLLTLAIRRCSAKASTTRQSLALVSPKSTSRFELRENFTTLNLLTVVHSNCQCLECDKYYSPRVLLMLTHLSGASLCQLSPSLWGQEATWHLLQLKKCTISDRALQVQRLPSHVLQSISSIKSLALWLFEIHMCAEVGLVLLLYQACSATKSSMQACLTSLTFTNVTSIRIPKARLKNQIRSG